MSQTFCFLRVARLVSGMLYYAMKEKLYAIQMCPN